ncbi:Uncharacterised protein [Vibrio cholerae]|nr:Uncharacterised protein [Vibrio cholerae]
MPSSFSFKLVFIPSQLSSHFGYNAKPLRDNSTWFFTHSTEDEKSSRRGAEYLAGILV